MADIQLDEPSPQELELVIYLLRAPSRNGVPFVDAERMSPEDWRGFANRVAALLPGEVPYYAFVQAVSFAYQIDTPIVSMAVRLAVQQGLLEDERGRLVRKLRPKPNTQTALFDHPVV